MSEPFIPLFLIDGFHGFVEIPDCGESARVAGRLLPDTSIGNFEYMAPIEGPVRLEETAYQGATLHVGNHTQRVRNLRLQKSELLPGGVRRCVYSFELGPAC